MLGDGGVSRIREFGQIACRPEVSLYFVILGSSFNEQETRTKLLDLKSLKFKKKSSYIIGKKKSALDLIDIKF